MRAANLPVTDADAQSARILSETGNLPGSLQGLVAQFGTSTDELVSGLMTCVREVTSRVEPGTHQAKTELLQQLKVSIDLEMRRQEAAAHLERFVVERPQWQVDETWALFKQYRVGEPAFEERTDHKAYKCFGQQFQVGNIHFFAEAIESNNSKRELSWSKKKPITRATHWSRLPNLLEPTDITLFGGEIREALGLDERWLGEDVLRVLLFLSAVFDQTAYPDITYAGLLEEVVSVKSFDSDAIMYGEKTQQK